MVQAVADLLENLDLERLEVDLFRGTGPHVGWQRVFGGQVIAQALSAATKTVEAERPCHSLHAYFVRPGDKDVPILYQVERIRDGRSFATRRTTAIQHGRPIFVMSASFQVEEEGLDHAFPAPPDVPPPEALADESEFRRIIMEKAPDNVRRYWERARPIELRPVDLRHYWSDEPLPPVQHVWVRTSSALPDDPGVHRCVLAYLSDMTLLDTSLFVHGRSVFNRDLQTASLDHAMWFHRPFRADGWLLYAMDSPSTSGSRGLSRGFLFDRDGRLVASTMQEGLIRLRGD